MEEFIMLSSHTTDVSVVLGSTCLSYAPARKLFLAHDAEPSGATNVCSVILCQAAEYANKLIFRFFMF